jgi:hypothetical protein
MKTIMNDQMKSMAAKLLGRRSKQLGMLVLLSLCIEPTFAIGLGAAQLKSALGQPLNVLVPVTSATPAQLDQGCFALVATARDDGGLPTILKAKLVLQRRDDGAGLRLTTSYAINDPVIAFAIESRCDGVVKRDYMLLLDMASAAETSSVTPPVSFTNTDAVAALTPARRSPAVKATPESRKSPVHHREKSVAERIAIMPPGLKLSQDLQWLPGEHPLSAEQLSDLKRMRSKLSIDAGGDTSTEDNLQDDIVATQKQLAQAKQELAQLRNQIVQAHQPHQQVEKLQTKIQPVAESASSSMRNLWLWLLVAGLIVALLVYLYIFRSRRQLPDFQQAIAMHAPELPAQAVATHGVSEDEDIALTPQDVFSMEELPGKTMLDSKTDMAKIASDSLSVSNLMRVTEEAEVFLELGYPERAIKVLTDDIAAHPRNRPAVWLMLLGIYRQQENREAFDEALLAFNADFNLVSPTWDDILLPEEEGEGLFTMPHVLAKVVSLWPGHECHDYLSELLYDDRHGTRQGFRLDVYRDIIWLKEVWAVLSQPESQIAEDVAANDMLDWDL